MSEDKKVKSHEGHRKRLRERFLKGGRNALADEALQAIEAAIGAGMIDAIPYESSFDDEQHFLYTTESETEPAIALRLPFYVIGPLQEQSGNGQGIPSGFLITSTSRLSL